jgi:RsiW-degrading membrane proteinase PrsW (M82 family)
MGGGYFPNSGRPPGGESSRYSFSSLVPVRHWARDPALRSWPVLLLLALVAVPPIAVLLLNQPTSAHLDDAAWIYAYYFAVAWLLLLGVVVRPQHVSRSMLLTVAAIGVVTQVPIALWLEDALHSSNGNLFASIFTIGLPEELAKAIPVVVVAWIWRKRLHQQTPRDYLFLGAVSGLVFGAVEAERYFTLGLGSLQGNVNGPELQALTISYVWRFLTDPISHACWAGITGYFIGLAITGTHRRHWAVGPVGIGIAAILHGFNDWTPINPHPAWVVVIVVSVLLFLGYARAGAWVPNESLEGTGPVPLPGFIGGQRPGNSQRPAPSQAAPNQRPAPGQAAPGQAAPGQPGMPGHHGAPSHRGAPGHHGAPARHGPRGQQVPPEVAAAAHAGTPEPSRQPGTPAPHGAWWQTPAGSDRPASAPQPALNAQAAEQEAATAATAVHPTVVQDKPQPKPWWEQ